METPSEEAQRYLEAMSVEVGGHRLREFLRAAAASRLPFDDELQPDEFKDMLRESLRIVDRAAFERILRELSEAPRSV